MSAARDSFVAKFGEDQAIAIEAAAQSHVPEDRNMGSEPFLYWFLGAIGYDCITRFRAYHGITADVEQMRDWAKGEGRLGEFDGEIPDYISLMAGAYNDWIPCPAVLGGDA